jgi:SAM-dependent methyltransferase
MAIKKDSIKLITEVCASRSGLKVLDVGCGDKAYKNFIGENNIYVGIDVEDSGRPDDKKTADIYYDGINIPMENNSIDIILFLEVLEHVQYPEKLLPELSRVLKPSGQLIFSIPFIWPLHEEPFDFRRFTTYQCVALFNELGFTTKKILTVDNGWRGLVKLLNSLAHKSESKVSRLILKLFALISRLMFSLNKHDIKSLYITNLALFEKKMS